MTNCDWRSAVQVTEAGVRVAIRLTPKGRRDGIEGIAETVDGGAEIRACVTAVPENGKANKALIKLLSKTWKVPKTGISFVSGETDRHKVLLLSGAPDEIQERIAQSLSSG